MPTTVTVPACLQPRSALPLPALLLMLLVALPLASGPALAQARAGDALVDEGRYQEASEAYQTAIEANPDDAAAHIGLAAARTYHAETLGADQDEERQHWFALAEQSAVRAVELAPDDPDAHVEVARALGRLAQYRGVLNALNLASRVEGALERATELDPEHAAAWHALALYHAELPWIAGGRSGLVVPYFERAVEHEPEAITHRVAFAEILIDRERYDEARAQLEAAADLPLGDQQDRDAAAKSEALRDRLP